MEKKIICISFLFFLLSLFFPIFKGSLKESVLDVGKVSGISYLSFLNQYNLDSAMELQTAAIWPNDYIPRGNSVRVNRPLYHFLSHVTGKVFNLPISLFISKDMLILDNKYSDKIGTVSVSIYTSVFLAALLLNYLMYLCILFINLKIIRKIFKDKEISEFSTLLLASSPLFIFYLRQIHTNIFGIFVVFIFYYLIFKIIYFKKFFQKTKNVLLISLTAGLLLLGKAEYSVFLLLAIVIFLKKGIRKFLYFLFLSQIPLCLWVILCHYLGIRYFNYEWDHYHQGKWIFNDYLFLPFWEKVNMLAFSIYGNLLILLRLYTPLSLFVYFYFLLDKHFNKKLKFFTLILIIFQFLFLFAIKRSSPLYLAPFMIIFYPLNAYYFLKIFNKYKIKNSFFYLVIVFNFLLSFIQ